MGNVHQHHLVGSKDTSIERKTYEQRYVEDLLSVLATPEGRRVFARLLCRLGHGEASWRPNSAIYRATALKDFAEVLLLEVSASSEEAYFNLLREVTNYRRKGHE